MKKSHLHFLTIEILKTIKNHEFYRLCLCIRTRLSTKFVKNALLIGFWSIKSAILAIEARTTKQISHCNQNAEG